MSSTRLNAGPIVGIEMPAGVGPTKAIGNFDRLHVNWLQFVGRLRESDRVPPPHQVEIDALGRYMDPSSLSFGERRRRASQLHLQGRFPGWSRMLRQRTPGTIPFLSSPVFRVFPPPAGRQTMPNDLGAESRGLLRPGGHSA